MALSFDQERQIMEAADQLRALYDTLCIYLHDEQKRVAIWEAISERTEMIEALVAGRHSDPR